MCDKSLIDAFLAKGGIIKQCPVARPDLEPTRPGIRRAVREREGTNHGSFYKHC